MKTHRLKTWPEAFDATYRGEKTAEFRKNDRDFEVGDLVTLERWDPETEVPRPLHVFPDLTLREIVKRITHIVYGPDFGIPKGYAMLSLGKGPE